jgi:hypothetical protein
MSEHRNLGPGIYPGIPEGAYHADCANGISASASILKKVYLQSPLHAWHAHPKLNPDFEESAGTDAQHNGTILHAMVLGQPAPYRELFFDNYLKGDAKAAKQAAIDSGFIPILSHKLDELKAVANVTRQKLAAEQPQIWEAINHPDTLKEATIIWDEAGVRCRVRFDILPPKQFGFSCDLKFTGKSAEPEEWSRTLARDYLFQADLYPRAVKAMRGDSPEFRFIVVETEEPNGISVHAMGLELMDVAKSRVNTALAKWSQALRSNVWPGYPSMVCYAEAPVWLMRQDDERAAHDTFIKDHAA